MAARAARAATEYEAEVPVRFAEIDRAGIVYYPRWFHYLHVAFEEFCADTIPLLMLDRGLAEAVYGPAARELTLKGRVAEKILDALRRPDHYRGVVEDVRRHLLAHHSYRRRVEELVTALD